MEIRQAGWTWGAVILLAWTCSKPVWGAEPAAANEIANAVEGLASADFAERERAEQTLKTTGEAARDALEVAAANSQEPERQERAAAVLAVLNAKAVKRERPLNEAAYQTSYLPKQKALQESAKNKWLVICSGKLGPVDAAGAPQPAATMEDAAQWADNIAARAQHRFIFKIGEEGDIECNMGHPDSEREVGNAFIANLSSTGWSVNSTDGFVDFRVIRDGKEVGLGVPGPDQRPYIQPVVSMPGTAGGKSLPLLVATGFGGNAILAHEDLLGVGLTRWEIPGEAKVQCLGGDPVACRRSYAQFRVEALKKTFTVPVAFWPEQK